VKKAGGYIRVSTEAVLARNSSIGVQERAIEAYCRAQGFRLIGLYVDVVSNSAPPDEIRPGLAQLINDALDGKVDVVIVGRLDQLSCSTDRLFSLLEILEAQGVAVVSIEDSVM